MARLFVGLELSPTIKKSLDFARGGVEGARWQRDEQLHLTLAFLGEVPAHMVRDVENALSYIDFQPFCLTLESVGMFGSVCQPKTLWTGVVDEEPLHHLHEKIMVALEAIGLTLDRRRYKPHVTLARFARRTQARIEDWLMLNGTLKSPEQQTSHFSLFSSRLTADGPSYLVEARFGDVTGDNLDEAANEGFILVEKMAFGAE